MPVHAMSVQLHIILDKVIMIIILIWDVAQNKLSNELVPLLSALSENLVLKLKIIGCRSFYYQ